MRQDISNYTKKQAALCEKNNAIGKKLYSEFGVKKGSQDEKGQGVLTGLTKYFPSNILLECRWAEDSLRGGIIVSRL